MEDSETNKNQKPKLIPVESSRENPILHFNNKIYLGTTPSLLSEQEYSRRMIKQLLRLWAASLEANPDQNSNQFKKDLSRFLETRKALKPVVHQLKKNQMDHQLSDKLYRLFVSIREKDYLLANTVYMELGVGNSPWPIGVSDVNIHKRAARDRIRSEVISHHMNDPRVQLVVTCIKRLLTLSEKLLPKTKSKSTK